jgi:hypothetical protein
MDQTTLVGPDVDVGRDAIAALDAAGRKPAMAMMAVFPEYGDWRLVLSSPSLDQTHLLKAHEQVANALGGKFVYRLPVVMVLPMKDPFVRALRKIFGKVASVEGMRLGGQMIGNRFLEKAYVYRIQ